jgi:hypothetical protein
MEINKNKYNNIKYESDDTLNYSHSSISLHFNIENFEKDRNLEIYIKDKDKLLKEYIFLKKIGQGTFGVVVLAIHKNPLHLALSVGVESSQERGRQQSPYD